MNADVAGDEATRRHKALGTASRARILDALRASGAGLAATEVARSVGLHHNTVRWHLDRLVEAGLATRRSQPRLQPGRPQVVFEASAAADAPAPPAYQLLARILATYVAQAAPDPGEAAVELGRIWGHYLTEAPSPLQAISAEEAAGRLVARFADLGFQPEREALSRETAPPRPAARQVGEGPQPTERILLHRCPFKDLAAERQDVICSIHLGLMHGLLAELRAPLQATTLVPFAGPDLCIAELAPTG